MHDQLQKYSIRETANTTRIRMKDPATFKQDSFRIIPLGRDTGIRAVVGILSGGKSVGTKVQIYIFDKRKWTKIKAEAWIKRHAQKFEIVSKL